MRLQELNIQLGSEMEKENGRKFHNIITENF